MTELAVAVLIVLALSAFCSGTEAALFSISMVRVRALADEGGKSRAALLQLKEDMARPIASIVVLNNVANIVGSIVVGNIAGRVLGDQWLGVFSGVLTFLVIVCAEIIPKTLGERHAEAISLGTARIVLGLAAVLSPLIWLIERITAPFRRGSSAPTTNEVEIRLLARIGQQEGVIESVESEIVQRAFRLNDQRAREIMTPRVALTRLHAEARLSEVKRDILDSQHSRIVVTGSDIDDLRGVALKDDLLAALVEGKHDAPVGDFARDAVQVPPGARCDALLQRFLSTRGHLAVVVDEFGGIDGVVTLEDVLETVTGEIVDETDRVVDMRSAAKSIAP